MLRLPPVDLSKSTVRRLAEALPLDTLHRDISGMGKRDSGGPRTVVLCYLCNQLIDCSFHTSSDITMVSKQALC